MSSYRFFLSQLCMNDSSTGGCLECPVVDLLLLRWLSLLISWFVRSAGLPGSIFSCRKCVQKKQSMQRASESSIWVIALQTLIFRLFISSFTTNKQANITSNSSYWQDPPPSQSVESISIFDWWLCYWNMTLVIWYQGGLTREWCLGFSSLWVSPLNFLSWYFSYHF